MMKNLENFCFINPWRDSKLWWNEWKQQPQNQNSEMPQEIEVFETFWGEKKKLPDTITLIMMMVWAILSMVIKYYNMKAIFGLY